MPSKKNRPSSVDVTEDVVAELAQTAAALSDPARWRIMFLLAAAGELHVLGLVEKTGMKQPTVMHHLTVLRYAGLVARRRDGHFVHYRALTERLEQLHKHVDVIVSSSA